MIVRAIPDDHEALTDLTKKSKAYWGYSGEQMAQWDAQLTINPGYILECEVYKLVVENEIIGYYSLVPSETGTVTLDNLFIDPDFMGKGYGKLLLDDAIRKARRLQYTTIILEADPNAEAFYTKFGFRTISRKETTERDRSLPVMQLQLQ